MTKLTTYLISVFTALFFIFFLSGCDSSVMRALDDYNAGMGAQRTCRYEATSNESVRGNDYNFSFGGLCNYWEGTLDNWGSKYTVRCSAVDGYGNRLRSVYAKPGENTGTVSMGSMNGSSIDVNCKYWERNTYVAKSNRYYDVEVKMSSGKEYVRLRNTSSVKRRCFVKNKGKDHKFVDRTINSGEVTPWGRFKGSIEFNCVYV